MASSCWNWCQKHRFSFHETLGRLAVAQFVSGNQLRRGANELSTWSKDSVGRFLHNLLINLCNLKLRLHIHNIIFPPSKKFSRHVVLHLKALPSPTRWCGQRNCLHLHNYAIKMFSLHGAFCLNFAWSFSKATWVEIKWREKHEKINTKKICWIKKHEKKLFLLFSKMFTNCRSIVISICT